MDSHESDWESGSEEDFERADSLYCEHLSALFQEKHLQWVFDTYLWGHAELEAEFELTFIVSRVLIQQATADVSIGVLVELYQPSTGKEVGELPKPWDFIYNVRPADAFKCKEHCVWSKEFVDKLCCWLLNFVRMTSLSSQ